MTEDGSARRRRRLPARARLTLTSSALVTAAGAVMVVVIYAFMRFVPTYALATVAEPGQASTATSTAPPGVGSLPDTIGVTLDGAPAALLIRDQADILSTLLVASVVILVLLAGVTSWVSWIIAGRILRPLQEITEAAQRAASGSFDHRVGLDGPPDEITELARTFDDMLGRLDRSFHAYQRFAANASHELRTPLATMQAMLDVAAHGAAAGAPGTRELLAKLRQTNDRSVRTVDAILDLADAGQTEPDRRATDLEEIVADAIDEVRPIASARRIAIENHRAGGTIVSADGRMLEHAVGNLLRNAVRHNVDGGRVSVTVGRAEDASPVLVVENTGACLAETDVARFTEPFFRGSGRIDDGGASRGLGLAIVEAIAEAHGAALELEPRADGGLRVVLRFVEPAVVTA